MFIMTYTQVVKAKYVWSKIRMRIICHRMYFVIGQY